MTSLDRAQRLHEKGDLKGAIAGYRRALAQARREEDGVGAALALNSLGSAYLDFNVPDKARRALEEALTLAREEEDLPGELDELTGAILHNLGNVFRATGEADAALVRYREALRVQRRGGTVRGTALTLGTLAELLREEGHLEEAAEVCTEALDLQRELRDRDGELFTLGLLGDLLLRLERYADARSRFAEAAALAGRLHRSAELAAAHMGLGQALVDLGSAEEALEEWRQVVELTRALGDRDNEAGACENLGNVCHSLGRSEEACEHLLRAKDLREESGDRTDLTRVLGKLVEVCLALGRLHEALQHRERALQLLEETATGWTRGKTHHHLGMMSLNLGLTETALGHFEEALKLGRETGDVRLETDSLQALGETCRRRGRLTKARELLAAAVDGYRRQGDRTSEAETLYGLARVQDEDARPEEALATYSRSLALRQDADGRAKTMCALAQILTRLGRFEEGDESYRSSIDAARQAGDRKSQGVALLDFGISLHNRMRLEPALDHYHRALAAFREAGERVREGEVLGLLGGLYSELGLEEKALETIEGAIAKLEKELGSSDVEGADEQVAAIHRTVAGLYARRERWWEAVSHLEKALGAARQAGDSSREAECLMLLAQIHNQQDDVPEALQRASQAFTIARRSGDAARAGDYGRLVAQLLRLAGHPDDALSMFRRALTSARKIGHRWGEADALWGLGALAFDKRDLDEAGEYFAEAMTVLESVRREISSPDLRASHFGVHQELYRNAIRLAVEKGDLSRAVHLAERRAARTFLDLLGESWTEIVPGVDPELREEERRLLAEQAALDQRRQVLARSESEEARAEEGEEERASTDEEEELRQRDLELDERWRAHQAEIRRRSPHLADIMEPEIVEVATIQRELLDEETVLLIYILDEPESLLLAVLQGEVHSFLLPPGKEIAVMVQELRDATTNPGSSLPLPHSFELYKALLQPAAGLLGARRLLVVPDGHLHLLPFSLLLTEPAVAGQAPESLPYLVRRHAVAYLPSASVACQLRRQHSAREGSWDRQLMAFGDPLVAEGGDDAPLALARAEVTRIAALFEDSPSLPAVERRSLDRFDGRHVSLRLGGEATKDAVESRFDPATGRESVRFVHFATHGRADIRRPQFSYLLFSPGPAGDPHWRTLEIFKVRLRTELVVLSACESGLGKVVEGEGLLGLARAFFYAGATSLCASLWRVDDAATAWTMLSFYRHLLTDQGDDGAALFKAEALRRAQNEIVQQGGLKAHPFFWAAFVVAG